MTKHEYLVEEVRDMAAEISDYGGTQAGLMLNSYADLLEQIERAKDGVTDEVVRKVMNAAMQAPIAYAARETRKALQSIAHLLPSGERVVVEGIDEVAKECVRDLRKHAKQCYNLPKLADDLRRLANRIERKMASSAHPPAQAAQVDDKVVVIRDGKTTTEGLVLAAAIYMGAVKDIFALRPDGQPYNERRVTKDTGALRAFDHLDAATKALRSAISHFNAPTAEPVAQGEVADKHERELLSLIDERDRREEIIDCLCDAVLGQGRPEWSSAYGYDDALLEVQEAMFAQPRAVPDGWVLVPREPTEAMFMAGQNAHFQAEEECRTELSGEDYKLICRKDSMRARRNRAAHVYRAMLAAAPQPGESS